MKRTGIVLVVFFLGCATGGVAAQLASVPPARADVAPARWEYYCARVDGPVNAHLKQVGEQGWEMVTAFVSEFEVASSGSVIGGASMGGGAQKADVFNFCYKRPLP
jgi:hypothetical protein